MPEPPPVATGIEMVRFVIVAVPSVLAGFTLASLCSVHLAFIAAAIFLRHWPTAGTPPSTVPFRVLTPALCGIPAAIVLVTLIGRHFLLREPFRSRLLLQLFAPTFLFLVIAAMHIMDPFGARRWLFGP